MPHGVILSQKSAHSDVILTIFSKIGNILTIYTFKVTFELNYSEKCLQEFISKSMNTNTNIKNDLILPYDVIFAENDVILVKNDVISQNDVIFKI